MIPIKVWELAGMFEILNKAGLGELRVYDFETINNLYEWVNKVNIITKDEFDNLLVKINPKEDELWS